MRKKGRCSFAFGLRGIACVFPKGSWRTPIRHDVAVPFFIAPQFEREKMRNKLIWPAVAITCAFIVATGIYLGLRDSQPQPTTQPYYRSPSSDNTSPAPEPDKNDLIVYVTRTGECYHRGSCGYLRSSKIPMKLSEARRRYRPCSRCRPPQ